MDRILIPTDHIIILESLFLLPYLDSVYTFKDFMDNTIDTSMSTMCMGRTL